MFLKFVQPAPWAFKETTMTNYPKQFHYSLEIIKGGKYTYILIRKRSNKWLAHGQTKGQKEEGFTLIEILAANRIWITCFLPYMEKLRPRASCVT